MKKLFTLILVLCHMNASMFLPQVAEVDVININGQHKDDINSIAEYICIILGYDYTPDDEDDDTGQNFHLVNAGDYFYQQEFALLEKKSTLSLSRIYTVYNQRWFSNLFYDVIAPPPKA